MCPPMALKITSIYLNWKCSWNNSARNPGLNSKDRSKTTRKKIQEHKHKLKIYDMPKSGGFAKTG